EEQDRDGGDRPARDRQRIQPHIRLIRRLQHPTLSVNHALLHAHEYPRMKGADTSSLHAEGGLRAWGRRGERGAGTRSGSLRVARGLGAEGRGGGRGAGTRPPRVVRGRAPPGSTPAAPGKAPGCQVDPPPHPPPPPPAPPPATP